jgi:hypothetical protein
MVRNGVPRHFRVPIHPAENLGRLEINPRRRATSISGTHSYTEPRAIVKKFFRSGLMNRPFPSARLVAIENAARLS